MTSHALQPIITPFTRDVAPAEQVDKPCARGLADIAARFIEHPTTAIDDRTKSDPRSSGAAPGPPNRLAAFVGYNLHRAIARAGQNLLKIGEILESERPRRTRDGGRNFDMLAHHPHDSPSSTGCRADWPRRRDRSARSGA